MTSEEYLEGLKRQKEESDGWQIPTLDQYRTLIDLFMAEQDDKKRSAKS